MKPAEILDRAKKLQSESRWDEAESVLSQGVRQFPAHPELNAAYGIALCLHAREAQALHHVEAANSSELLRMLAAHFHLKALADRKLGICDAQSQAAFESLAKLAAKQNVSYGPLPDLRLSACLIVKDEQANLPECLASIAGVVDEIVVVDTGSCDDTVDVALAFGAKVGVFEWCDDFAAARNASLDLATGTWALWIDADERLASNSQTALLSAMIRPHFGGFTIPIINFLSEDLKRDQLEHRPCRLFRLLPEIRFEGRIHEQITPSIARLGMPVAQLEGATIEHYGYLKSEMAEKEKIKRTVAMLQAELGENPTDSFQHFNLGNAYFTAGEFEKAAKEFELAADKGNGDYGQYMRHLWAFSLHNIGRFEDAIAICDTADAAGYGGVLIDYSRACSLAELGRLEQALESTRSAKTKKLNPGEPGDRSIEQWKVSSLETAILVTLQRKEEALEQAKANALEQPHNRDLWLDWIKTAEVAENSVALAEAFLAGANRFEFDSTMCVAAGRALECVGQLQNALECYHQAIELDPTNANAYFCAGDLLLKNSCPFESAECYQKGLLYDSANAEAWFMLGNAMYRSGSVEGAVLSYKKALEADPNHHRAASNLEIVLSDQEESAA